jgi:hypothetical protein
MIRVRILDFHLNIFEDLYTQDKINEALEAISYVGYIKDIKINTTNDKIIYTIIYEEA